MDQEQLKLNNEKQEEIKTSETEAGAMHETPEEIKRQIEVLQEKLKEAELASQEVAKAETARIDKSVADLGVGSLKEIESVKTEVREIEAEKQVVVVEAETNLDEEAKTVETSAEGVEKATDNIRERESDEQIEKTDPRLEKYMGTIRDSLNKIKELSDERNKLKTAGIYGTPKLDEKIYNIKNFIKYGKDFEGKNIIDLPKKDYGEDEYQYSKRVDEERRNFNNLVEDNSEIITALIEAGEIIGDSQYGFKNKVSSRLCGDKKFIKKALDLLENSDSGNYNKGAIWGGVRGEVLADKDLYLRAVKLNPLNYQFGLKEWKSDPEVQKVAVDEGGLDPTYLYKG